MSRATPAGLAAVLILTLAVGLARPPAAQALSVGGALCDIGGAFSSIIGKGCEIAGHAGRLLNAGRKLLGGHLGQAVSALGGGSSAVRRATSIVGLAAIAASIFDGTRFALHQVAGLVSDTTEPQLGSGWFGGAYGRMAGVAALLTLPLLLAAVGQAIVRSDLGLLARTAFGFVPLAGLAVGLAIPLTVLLVRGSDEMAALVSRGVDPGAAFDVRAVLALAGFQALATHSVFLGFAIGLVACLMTVVLWIELAVRQAAVTVVVLMLPLFFAALVWPARRVWAARAVELLVSLILAKFAIVAVLSLGASALTHATPPGTAAALLGVTLVMLAALSPWALLRILPLHELAGAAASSLRPAGGAVAARGARAEAADEAVHARAGDGEGEGEAAGPSPSGSSADGGDAAEQLLVGAGGLGGWAPPEGRPGGDGSIPPPGGGPAAGGGVGGGPAGSGGPEPLGPSGTPAAGAAGGAGRTSEPRRSSDVDPIITRAPDFGWRPMELGPGELENPEPLYDLTPEPDDALDPDPAADLPPAEQPPVEQAPGGSPQDDPR